MDFSLAVDRLGLAMPVCLTKILLWRCFSDKYPAAADRLQLCYRAGCVRVWSCSEISEAWEGIQVGEGCAKVLLSFGFWVVRLHIQLLPPCVLSAQVWFNCGLVIGQSVRLLSSAGSAGWTDGKGLLWAGQWDRLTLRPATWLVCIYLS